MHHHHHQQHRGSCTCKCIRLHVRKTTQETIIVYIIIKNPEEALHVNVSDYMYCFLYEMPQL